MKRLILLAVVMTLLCSTKPASAVWIEDVHTEPNQPTNRDSITIAISGKAGSAPVWTDNSSFRRQGTSLELDLFFTLGPYAIITSWSHSEAIDTLPVASYELTVRGYNYDELTGTYFLTDTYLTSFTVVADNSNSVVIDGIEYYVQTDKAVYVLDEEVQMLYKVTNLTDEEVTFSGLPSPPWNFWVRVDGNDIFRAVNRWWGMPTQFTLGPDECKEFPDSTLPYAWDMRDRDGNIVNPGEYTVVGGLYDGLGSFDYTKVAVGITIIPEPPTFYYVNAADGNDNNDGLSPETAFATIQKGIDSANNGDTVSVADGTYTSKYGPGFDFRGKAIIVRSENGPEPCVIDGQDFARGFYFHNGEDANSVLDGFTITNGYSATSGAILCLNSSPVIRNCNISGNRSEFDSGGICFENSSAIITNCTISNNSAREGGGISCFQSSVVITNCTISGNSAEDEGGGMCNVGSNPTITNCTFYGNSAEQYGGAIYCNGGSPEITRCTIVGNSAGLGGGIHSETSSPTITDCTISDNTARDGGAIYTFYSISLTITNCTISASSANNGGGIYMRGGNPTVANCIISGNISHKTGIGPHGEGGGIFCWESQPTIINCTITGNAASKGGGLNGCYGSISNCIVWDNSADNGPQLYHSTEPNYSCIQGWSDSGKGNIDADPCFVEPGYWADTNDPNIIVEPNDPNAIWVEGDYHLLAGSPSIDAGDPDYIPEPNETDLDGHPRVSGDAVDMGAYEYVPPIEAEVEITPQTANLASKGKWISCKIWLPEDYSVADVNSETILLEDEIPAERVWFSQEQNLVMAKFRRSHVTEIIQPGLVELTVTGELLNGTRFEGIDTIRVTHKGRKKKPGLDVLMFRKGG